MAAKYPKEIHFFRDVLGDTRNYLKIVKGLLLSKTRDKYTTSRYFFKIEVQESKVPEYEVGKTYDI